MVTPARGSLLDSLGTIPDPRSAHGRRHSLSAMLAAVCCAILCGARGFKPIAQWVHDQQLDLIHALGFTRRPPKWGAFRKLLLSLDPIAFEAALSRWAESCSAELTQERRDTSTLEPVALDGKTVRGSISPHRKAIHLLSAMAHRSGLTLIQAEVGEKTNEHKAALALLRRLVLQGRVVTGDAMFCQRDLCQAIIAQEGHYFLAVKENQPGLLRDIQDAFAPPPDAAFSPSATQPHRAAVRGMRHEGQATGPGRDPQAANDHAAQRLP
jgi:DDE_Tnp_1-associated/Transposase DDE domain